MTYMYTADSLQSCFPIALIIKTSTCVIISLYATRSREIIAGGAARSWRVLDAGEATRSWRVLDASGADRSWRVLDAGEVLDVNRATVRPYCYVTSLVGTVIPLTVIPVAHLQRR